MQLRPVTGTATGSGQNAGVFAGLLAICRAGVARGLAHCVGAVNRDARGHVMPVVHRVSALTNREFFAQHARAGRIGLVGGNELVNRMIARAQRRLTERERWSWWSHAFLFQGERVDGHQWVIESDLDVHRKHIRLGLQENRVAKYCDDAQYGVAAVLDFGLTPEQTVRVLTRALDLVADGTRYSLREIFGTVLAMRDPSARAAENPLARDRSFYCSAFVRHVFSDLGIELSPGTNVKHTTPEDLHRSPVEHTEWLLLRRAPTSRTQATLRRLRARLRIAKRGLS